MGIVLLIISVSVQYEITENQIYTSYQGFAVDSQGNLYLGVNLKIIAVDSNGLERYSFSTITNRGYSFTINEEDQILLRSSGCLYTMDLNGNVLKEDDKETADLILPLNKSTRSFRDAEGRIYQMSSRFFRKEIYKYERGEASLIYQMPVLNYAAKLVSDGLSLCFVILIPVIIWKTWGLNNKEL